MTRHTGQASETCRAALFLGAGRPLELREIPVPKVAASEALVRVECCTICGSDLHTLTGARTEPTPSILGHEVLGVVEEVGAQPLCDTDGNPLAPGDRVTWSVCVSCGACDRCRSGMPQKCRSLHKYGHALAEGRTALGGGLAERVLLLPSTAVVKIDAGVSAEVTCPVNCATATVAAAFRIARACAGRRVLILGAGMLGLTASAFARARQAERIVVCDPNAERRAQAKLFGADDVLAPDDLPESPSFDAVLEMSGSADAVEAALRHADVGATVVLVGSVLPSRPVSVDPESVIRRLLSIHGVHNYLPDDLRVAVDFLNRAGAQFPFASLVERAYPLNKVNDAVELAIRERPLRVAIRP